MSEFPGLPGQRASCSVWHMWGPWWETRRMEGRSWVLFLPLRLGGSSSTGSLPFWLKRPRHRPRVPSLVRWPQTLDPGARPPPWLNSGSPLCPRLRQLLYQLNSRFLELWSLLETPKGVSVVLVRSWLRHWSSFELLDRGDQAAACGPEWRKPADGWAPCLQTTCWPQTSIWPDKKRFGKDTCFSLSEVHSHETGVKWTQLI